MGYNYVMRATNEASGGKSRLHYLSADNTPVGLVYEPLGRLANPVTGAKASAAVKTFHYCINVV